MFLWCKENKVGKKGSGDKLKFSKNLNKLIQPKGNNFKVGHNNLFPLRESMKKFAESISHQASDALGLANPDMGNE